MLVLTNDTCVFSFHSSIIIIIFILEMKYGLNIYMCVCVCCRYGPFWICSTLVFLTAALGNFAAYLSYETSAAGESWHYDVTLIPWAALMFYGYAGVIPVFLFFLLRYMGVVSNLIHLWCLYGYSLFAFIPASVHPPTPSYSPCLLSDIAFTSKK